MNRKKTITMLILKLLCVILFPLSYIIDPEFSGEITFFTVQSNLFVLVMMIIFSIYDILKLQGKFITTPNYLYKIKLVSTTAISLTFIIFGIVLTPILIRDGRPDVVLSYSSIVMHQFIPLVAIVDWILDEHEEQISFYFTPISVSFPLYYFIFTLIASNCGVTYPSYANGVAFRDNVPYFFLDYEKYGWFRIDGYNLGVAYWLVIITLGVLLMSFLLILIKNLQFIYKNKKAIR